MNTIRMMDRIASVKRFSPKKVRLHFVYKLFVLDVRISIVPEIQCVILKKIPVSPAHSEFQIIIIFILSGL